ncbi:MAG: hypothetical protein IKY72_02865 [Bacteroidaceae bacterium]|nr:hypothetical protein [Bacteroidaceae bacterium]
MKTNLSKRLSVVTGFVIFFGVLNILLLLAKAENAVGIWSNPLGKWDEEWYAWKVLILAGYVIFGLIVNILTMVFMLNSIKLIKCGEFFSKRNANFIWWSAPVYFLSGLCANNFPIIYGAPLFMVYPNTFFTPLLLIGVAIIYSAGVRLSEENRLTV